MNIKICTTIDQCKKLLGLGIDINTADMRYGYIAPYDFSDRMYDGGYDEVPYPKDFLLKNPNFSANEYDGELPAWSLAALEGLMPFHIIENNNRFGFYQVKGFNKQGETYRFCYKTNNDSFLFETSWYNDVIDAAFEIVVWLKENNKI